MMISTKGRYALRVLIDMAEHQTDGYIPLKEIAKRQGISEKYLESIVKLLVKGGVVEGMRGKGGGYPDYTYRRVHAPQELADAYLSAAGRGKRRLPPPAQAFSGIVARKIVSVSSKIVYVLHSLREKKTVRDETLLEGAESKSDLVATFLALLELMKARRIRVDGEGKDLSVRMQAEADDGAAFRSEYDTEETNGD